MSHDPFFQLKQNELHVEFGRFHRLVEMDVDTKRDRFKLTFDKRLATESAGQVLIKCHLPEKGLDLQLKKNNLTFDCPIDDSTLRQLRALSMEQEQMRLSTDYKAIPGWLEKSLQRISDLRLGRDMVEVLSRQRPAPPLMYSEAEMLQDHINKALRREVSELTRDLRVRPDGIAHIRALLNIGGNEANAPMIRYGLNAVNSWNAPQLQDLLQWIAGEHRLPADVRNAAASFL